MANDEHIKDLVKEVRAIGERHQAPRLAQVANRMGRVVDTGPVIIVMEHGVTLDEDNLYWTQKGVTPAELAEGDVVAVLARGNEFVVLDRIKLGPW